MKIHGALMGAGTLALLAGLAIPDAAMGQVRDPAQPEPAQPADRPDADADRQQPGQTRPGQARPGQQQPGVAQQQDSKLTDKKIATWVALIDHKEVSLGKEAAQKATNPQVKQFAQKMVDEHSQSLEKLSRFGVDASATLAAAGEGRDRAAGFRPGEDRPGEARPGEDRDRPAQPGQPGATARPAEGEFDLIMVKREIAQNTLKAALDELRSKQGAEFDKCYIGHQVMSHMEAQHTLEALSRHASPELRQLLQQEAQTVKQHLNEAKQIAQTLDRDSSRPDARPGVDARRPGAAPQRPGTQPQPGAQPGVPQ